LLDNAIKYSPEGGPVTVKARPLEMSDGRWVEVVVEDQGLGIPANELEAIFQRFQRGSNARGKKITGTGMGLAYAREIVVQHGGTLEVESTEGEGSRFILRVPAGQSASLVR
jgi:two-component system phosphate regulon sensor histidine kinase PhoR